MPTITLAIPDMSCGHCVASIKEALKGQPGVARCDVDLARKQVRLDLSDQTALPRVQTVLAGEGFPATVVR